MGDLNEEIIKLYTRSGFGKVLKSEVDTIVFHHLLLDKLKVSFKDLLKDEKIIYYLINKEHIRVLSLEFRITEAAFTRLLENDFLLSLSEPKEESSVNDILLELILKREIKRENIKNGKLCFYISNPIPRKILETELFKIGGIADYSFNRDLFIIEFYDLLRLLNFSNDKEISRRIKEEIINKISKEGLTKDDTKYLDDFEKKRIPEQLKTILKGAAGHFAGKFIGEEASNEAINLVIGLLNSARDAYTNKKKKKGNG